MEQSQTQTHIENARILIVDDEPSARNTLEILLFSEGYQLLFAASGEEALARLDEFKLDTILLDVMMPGLDGFAVCQQLKAHKQWRHIPVILITALDNKEDLVRGLDAGADEFLSKPVNGVELRARVRTMLRIKKQYDELEANLHLREDLASMMAHDMRSPLTAIKGFSQLLTMDSTTDTEILEFSEKIFAQANRLDGFLNDILLMTKIEQNQLILNRSSIDINFFLMEAEKNYRVIAQSRGINLALVLPDETQQIRLDTNLFQRLLDNLISNALKFSPSGSTVTLQVEFEPANNGQPRLRLKVIDEGCGIPEEHHEHIFDKFKTVDLKKQDVPQVGLGLAFCKMVVDAHEGCIFVETNQPNGSVFVVEL